MARPDHNRECYPRVGASWTRQRYYLTSTLRVKHWHVKYSIITASWTAKRCVSLSIYSALLFAEINRQTAKSLLCKAALTGAGLTAAALFLKRAHGETNRRTTRCIHIFFCQNDELRLLFIILAGCIHLQMEDKQAAIPLASAHLSSSAPISSSERRQCD